MESQIDTTVGLSREGSMISRGKAMEHDHDQLPSSVSSSTPSRTDIDISLLSSYEIKLLEEAAQENESGQQFLTAVESVSWKYDGFHATNLVETFSSPGSRDTLLHMAVRNGKKEVVMCILDMAPSLLKTKNAVGETVWHVIASTGHLDVFLCLMFYRENQIASKIVKNSIVDHHGCDDLLDKNMDGNTALHVAMINYQEEIAMSLYKMNPKLCNILNSENKSATYLAAHVGYLSLLKTMPMSDSESTPMEIAHTAITGKQLGVLKDIMSRFESLFSTRFNQKIAIHLAVACGFIKGVEFFIKLYGNGVAMLKDDNLEQNLLHVAAMGKDFEMVSFFLDNKDFEGMIREQDKKGNTPLHLAARNCRFMATYSLAWHRKVDLTQLDNEGLNPLESAELFTKEYFSLSKWLTLSTLRAAGMRSSSPSRPNYIAKLPPVSATFDLSKSRRKQVISILVVVLIVVAVSAFVGIFITSYIGPAYSVTKSRRLRLAALSNMSILLISILFTPSLILLHDSKYLQMVIFKLVVPFLKVSVTAVLVQVVGILFIAVRNLDWLSSVISATTLCLIGILFTPFLPIRLPVVSLLRMIIRKVSYYPLWLLLTLCHFIR